MPICEIDPWRTQYFVKAECPAEINIPTEDSDAWMWNPEHRWIYDKIAIALSQKLQAGPHGTRPPRFPVFSKPIVNLRGMGIGSRVFVSDAEYQGNYIAGHMWMTPLDGDHLSTDAAVVAGEAFWWRHATGIPAGHGTFDYWTVHANAEPELEARLGAWVSKHLPGYTGMLNLETIGASIIEVHLRVTDQWPDLYGPGWVDALVRLYRDRVWNYDDRDRRDGFSVALFGPANRQYRYPPPAIVAEVLRVPGVSSVQITFHESRDPSLHAMPPGGFRLAIVNSWELASGFAGRDKLRRFFLG